MDLLALCLAAAAAAAPSRGLEFRFLGNMAFHITDGRTTLVTDFPYRSGYSGYMTWRPADVPPLAGAAALITHGHPDHFEPSLVEGTDLTLLAPPDVLRTVPQARRVPFGPHMRFGGAEVEAFATPHARLDHYSYRVTWLGRRLYFTGDTESTDQLLAMTGLDVAFVSPWLLRAVARQGRRIDARRVVVYHQEKGEVVPDLLGRVVYGQGEGFRLEAATPHP